jgi:hypothetical protein
MMKAFQKSAFTYSAEDAVMGLKWTKRNGEQILRYIKEIF